MRIKSFIFFMWWVIIAVFSLHTIQVGEQCRQLFLQPLAEPQEKNMIFKTFIGVVDCIILIGFNKLSICRPHYLGGNKALCFRC